MSSPEFLLPVRPNWSSSLTLTLEYLTRIVDSHDGSEQRKSLRIAPRETMEFSILNWRDHRREVSEILMKARGGIFYIADFTAPPARLLYDEPAGTGILDFVAQPTWSVGPGDRVVLWDGKNWAMRTITNAWPGLIVAPPDGRAWPAGTRVYPALRGRLGATTMSTPSDDIGQATIAFSVDPGSRSSHGATSGASLPTFQARPLLLDKPNWAEAITDTIDFRYTMLDFERGRVRSDNPLRFEDRVFDMLYSANAAPRSIVGLFAASKGRRGEFFFPSNTADLRIASNVTAGASVLQVFDEAGVSQFAQSETHRAVVIRRPGVAAIVVGVTSVVQGAGVLTLRLASTLPAIAAQGATVSWLYLGRFASDSLVLEYITDSVLRTRVGMKVLPTLGPEIFGASEALAYVLTTYGEALLGDTIAGRLETLVNVDYPASTGAA